MSLCEIGSAIKLDKVLEDIERIDVSDYSN